MTLTDPREALADQSDFIGYLVGLAGLSGLVHTLASDSRPNEARTRRESDAADQADNSHQDERIPGAHFEEQTRHHATDHQRARDARDEATHQGRRRLTQDQVHDVRRLGAKRDADVHLAAPT